MTTPCTVANAPLTFELLAMNSLSKMLVENLRIDATHHENGNLLEVGLNFNLAEQRRSEAPDSVQDRNFAIAYTFWDCWIDQVRHGFSQNFYSGVTASDWPVIARELATNLEAGTPIANAVVLRHFDLAEKRM